MLMMSAYAAFHLVFRRRNMRRIDKDTYPKAKERQFPHMHVGFVTTVCHIFRFFFIVVAILDPIYIENENN